MMNRKMRIFGGSDCIDDNMAVGDHNHRGGYSFCALLVGDLIEVVGNTI